MIKRIQTYRVQTICGVALMLAVNLFITGCSSSTGKDYELDARSFTAESIQLVEKYFGMKLPAGSRGLNMFYRGSTIDPSFVAKIEIPTASHAIVSNHIAQYPIRSVTVINSLTQKVPWWNRTEDTIRIQRAFEGGVRVMLCQERESWILYVESISL